jgi:hypothetical protein
VQSVFPDALPSSTVILNEVLLRKALLSGWIQTEKYLDEFEIDATAVQDIANTILRTTALLHKRVRDAGERESVLTALVDYVATRSGSSPETLIKAIETLRFVESGYHGILTTFEQSDAAALLPEERVSAALADSARTFAAIFEANRNALDAATEVVSHHGLALDFIGDAAVVADDINDSVVNATSSILQMAAAMSNWSEKDGTIVVPALAHADAATSAVEVDQTLASSWAKWRLFEERLRYLGGALVLIQEDGQADTVQLLQDESIHFADACIHLARERLRAKFTGKFRFIKDSGVLELSHLGNAELPPKGFISFQEAATLDMLDETLSIAFSTDDNKYGGLRIVEWLRAHSVLQAIAGEAYDKNGEAGLLTRTSTEKLTEVFMTAGLSQDCAKAAVSNFSFGRNSTDLFDAPIIVLGTGDCVLFGPGLVLSNPLTTLLSIFAANGFDFKNKGPLFERAVRAVFEAQDMPTRCVDETVGGAQYECEVVTLWNGVTFALECKNRLLPGASPAQQYYFWKQLNDDVAQVRRFAEFLQREESVAACYFGSSPNADEIIPCISSSALMWCPPTDGVRFCDISMLQRFFDEKFVFIIKTVEVNGVNVMHRVAVDAIWEGEQPVLADFLRYLEDPPQIKALLPTITAVQLPFPVGDFVAVLPFFAPREATMEEILENFPVKAEAVRNEFSSLERGLAKRLGMPEALRDAQSESEPLPSIFRVRAFKKPEKKIEPST